MIDNTILAGGAAVDNVEVESNQALSGAYVTTHTFTDPSGATGKMSCLAIPLTHAVDGGRNGILAFSVAFRAAAGDQCSVFGPINNRGYMTYQQGYTSVLFDADAAALYVGFGTRPPETDAVPMVVVAYRKS